MVCPYCILGIAFGALAALGIKLSDLSMGVWFGAVTVISIEWLNQWCIKRYGKWFRFQEPVFVIAGLIALTIAMTVLSAPAGTCQA